MNKASKTKENQPEDIVFRPKKFEEYINEIMTKNPKTGKYSNPNDKADWVLFWWKK